MQLLASSTLFKRGCRIAARAWQQRVHPCGGLALEAVAPFGCHTFVSPGFESSLCPAADHALGTLGSLGPYGCAAPAAVGHPQLANLVISMASWISHWPGAQLLTERPQVLVVALLIHGLAQLGDGLVAGGAVWPSLVAGSPSRACCFGEHPWRCAQLPDGQEARCGASPCPPGLGDALGPCGNRRSFLLASAGSPHQGAPAGPIPHCLGQVLQSTVLAVQRLHKRSGALVLRVGSQRWELLLRPQALWPMQEQ